MIPIPPAFYAVAAAGVIGLASGAYAGHKWTQASWDAERLEQAEQHAEAEREARAVEQKRQRGANEVLDAYVKTARRAEAAAAADRASADGLRSQLAIIGSASSDSAAACPLERERVRVLSRLLDEAAQLAIEGGARLERCDAAATGLRGFIEQMQLDAPHAHSRK